MAEGHRSAFVAGSHDLAVQKVSLAKSNTVFITLLHNVSIFSFLSGAVRSVNDT